MKKFEYFIFNPGGNLTALVFDNHYNKTQRKNINDVISAKICGLNFFILLSHEYYKQKSYAAFLGFLRKSTIRVPITWTTSHSTFSDI